MTDMNEFFENIRNHVMNPLYDTWMGFSEPLFRTGLADREHMRSSVVDSLTRSRTIGLSPAAATRGSFHWWSRGSNALVGLDVDGGAESIFMPSRSSNLRPLPGVPDCGFLSFEHHRLANPRFSYLGWSMDYDGLTLEVAGRDAAGEEEPPLSDSRVVPAPGSWAWQVPTEAVYDTTAIREIYASVDASTRTMGAAMERLSLNAQYAAGQVVSEGTIAPLPFD